MVFILHIKLAHALFASPSIFSTKHQHDRVSRLQLIDLQISFVLILDFYGSVLEHNNAEDDRATHFYRARPKLLG